MSMLPRPQFNPGQALTSAALNAAQLYQLDLGRKHRAGAHLPGVIHGLKIEAEGLRLLAGYAVDAFGRDLVLSNSVSLDLLLDDARRQAPGADTFEVLLHYRQRLQKGANDKDDPTRLDETPQAEVRALVGPRDEPLPYDAVQTAPDDPDELRPVRVGVLEADRDNPGKWIVRQGSGDRQEAGLVAARVVPPPAKDQGEPDAERKSQIEQVARIELARDRFAVFLPAKVAGDDPGQVRSNSPKSVASDKPGTPPNDAPTKGNEPPNFLVDGSGATLRSALIVEGPIEAGKEISLATPGAASTMPVGACGIFRIGDEKAQPDTHELRLVLPAEGALAIGAWNQQTGKFEAVLTVDAATRSVTVAGDLIIEGAVIDRSGAASHDGVQRSGQDNKETTMQGNTLSALMMGWLSNTGGSLTRIVLLLGIGFGFVNWDRALTAAFDCKTAKTIRAVLRMAPPVCDNNILFGSDCKAKEADVETFSKESKTVWGTDTNLTRIFQADPSVSVYCPAK
jgi:hypothetical protein